ncbi:MAG: VTT domain-containing protein [Betaproteobacteria bacterium]
MSESSATSSTAASQDPARGAQPLLRPGHNCWKIERATRLAFLVDGAEYFTAVRAALARARRSFFILGWDIDSRMLLVPDGAGDGLPAPLGEFLNHIVSSRRGLRGYILAWDYAMLFALEREWLPIYTLDWKTHRRLSFHLDDHHPVGGSHHQKIIVVDDEVAFVSGFDLTGSRWDTSEHACENPLRVNVGQTPYGPFHDVGAVVAGSCARALGDICRERWRRATGRAATAPRSDGEGDGNGDAWPEGLAAQLENVDVAIARTVPPMEGQKAVAEIRNLHADAIASARRSIFAENQYFTSPIIAEALESRLAEPGGPEIVLVMPATQSGWLEAATMGVLRARLRRRLRAADGGDRYHFYCPSHDCPGTDDGCINVHSKVLIVDDEFLTLGSANLSNRSLCLDTECNLALEARGNAEVRRAIAGLRERLLGEHLGASAQAVATATREHPTLHAAIESLQHRPRRWLEAKEPQLDPAVDAITPDHVVLDPECPLDPETLIDDLLPEREGRAKVKLRVIGGVALLAVFAALALAWRYTPLGSYLDVRELIDQGDRIREVGWAPFAVPLVFVVAGFALIPVTLLIAVTVAVFGVLGGVPLAFAGAMASAAAGYATGRTLGRGTVRKIAGKRLNELSRRLARRGLLAVLLVRILPVAPFTVVNIVAGATHIGWRDFLLGSALGLIPGLVMTSAFVDRAIAAIRAPSMSTVATLGAVLAAIVLAAWAIQRSFKSSGQAAGRPAPSTNDAD